MNFIFKPSLQHIAAVKIVTTMLIENIDVIYYSYFCHTDTRYERWEEAREELTEKVKIMSLPPNLELQILALIKPIAHEIFHWMDLNGEIVDMSKFRFRREKVNLCWTSQGILDKRKTAEMWIGVETLHIVKRYKLACMYCLEDDIPKLWNRLSKAEKKNFYGRYAETVEASKLVIHWTFCLKEASCPRVRKTEYSQYRYAFLHAALQGNSVATEYFFVKLAPEEKKQLLLMSTRRVLEQISSRSIFFKGHFNETLCFLLSQLDEEQQMQVFHKYYFGVLTSLLDWPRQSLFLETSKLVWRFLSVDEFCNILNQHILLKFLIYRKDCNYDEIFKDFWQQSPLTHKKYVFNSHFALDVMLELIQIEDGKCIHWMLKDATSEEKHNLWCTRDYAISKRLICTKQENLLASFIRECKPSKDELTKLKRKLMDNSREQANGLNVEKKDELDRIFELIDAEIEKSVESNKDLTDN